MNRKSAVNKANYLLTPIIEYFLSLYQ